MSATFIERCIRVGDYLNDGDYADLDHLRACLNLYEAGLMTNTQIKTWFACTTPQGDDLDDILATMPTSSITLTVLGISVLGPNALTRARWVDRIISACIMGVLTHTDYNTEAKVKTKLGIA